MSRHVNSTRLVPALLASVVLHVLGAGIMGAFPAMGTPDLSAIDPPRFAMETVDIPPLDEPPPPPPEVPEPLPPPPPPPPELRLGMQNSTADAPAWLGFDTYEEHSATPSEIDQPELTMDPPPGAPEDQPAIPPIAGVPAQIIPESASESTSSPVPPAPMSPDQPAEERSEPPTASEPEPIIAPVPPRQPKPVPPPPPGGVVPQPTDPPLPQNDTPPTDEPGIQAPSAKNPGVPDTVTKPVEPPPPDVQAKPTDAEPKPGPTDAPPSEQVDAAKPAPPTEEAPREAPEPLDTPEPPPDTGPLPSDQPMKEPVKPKPADEPALTVPTEPTPPTPQPAEASPPPSPGAPPQPALPSGAGETAPGMQSDRESTATSILTMRRDQFGKPLAGKGLEIKTVRPRFTQYTKIMTAPQSPVFRIHFRKDGTVERVETLRSSGVADVDRPVIDAIYKWRAAGKELDQLPDPPPPGAKGAETPSNEGGKVPTVSIEMRILL